MHDAQAASDKQLPPGPQERVLQALCAIATGALLAWMLHYSRYGIDFTDESFYLIWISDPFLFDWSLTQFGFIYHPLYQILDGDIARLRQFNIGLVFLLSWCLTALALRASSAGATRSRVELAIVSAGFSVACLVTFSSWLTTPNYNTLAFQALLVASIGAVLAAPRATASSTLGWLLIGVGGWLAFMAKPSSAAALAVGTLVFLLVSRRFSWRLLGMAGGVALLLLLVSAWLIDGSIHGFVARLQTALTFYGDLGSGHTPQKSFRLDNFYLHAREKMAVRIGTGLAFVGAWCALAKAPRVRLVGVLVSLACLAFTLAIVMGAVRGLAGFGEFRSLIIGSIAMASIALAVVVFRARLPEYLRQPRWSLALLLVVMPYVYAFGTNSNYWWSAGFVGVFWLLGALILLGPLAQTRGGWAFALPLVFGTQALSALLVQTGMELPYRQPQALSANDSLTAVGRDGSLLVLSADFARYVQAIQSATQTAGLTPGTPVIDLTGQSPGVLYAMQAKSIGQPWTVGGYPGSQKLAEAALARVPCELLSTAWLLIEESGPRRLPPHVVASYGARFETQFALAATWQTAPGAGGYVGVREQKLLKPLEASLVLAECRNTRTFASNLTDRTP